MLWYKKAEHKSEISCIMVLDNQSTGGFHTTVLTGGGQRAVKLPPILPNSVQGGANHQSHVNTRWFDRLKIAPKMQKIA